jgi:C-terminal processing protease CtpA/Prc
VESAPAYAFYGVNVTVGDFLMSDGQRLEGKGVIPDILILSTERDLAEKTDPVLAYAATLLGTPVSAENAGKFGFSAPVPEPGPAKESLF